MPENKCQPITSMRGAGTSKHKSTQVKVQANITEQCAELYGDNTGKMNVKTKHKIAVESPVVVLTYVPLAIA